MLKTTLLAVAVVVGGSMWATTKAEAQDPSDRYDTYEPYGPVIRDAEPVFRRPGRTYRRYVVPRYYGYPTGGFRGPAFGAPLYQGPAFGPLYQGPAFGGPLFRGPAFGGPIYGPPNSYRGW